jgi:hypothetical protein
MPRIAGSRTRWGPSGHTPHHTHELNTPQSPTRPFPRLAGARRVGQAAHCPPPLDRMGAGASVDGLPGQPGAGPTHTPVRQSFSGAGAVSPGSPGAEAGAEHGPKKVGGWGGWVYDAGLGGHVGLEGFGLVAGVRVCAQLRSLAPCGEEEEEAGIREGGHGQGHTWMRISRIRGCCWVLVRAVCGACWLCRDHASLGTVHWHTTCVQPSMQADKL